MQALFFCGDARDFRETLESRGANAGKRHYIFSAGKGSFDFVAARFANRNCAQDDYELKELK